MIGPNLLEQSFTVYADIDNTSVQLVPMLSKVITEKKSKGFRFFENRRDPKSFHSFCDIEVLLYHRFMYGRFRACFNINIVNTDHRHSWLILCINDYFCIYMNHAIEKAQGSK